MAAPSLVEGCCASAELLLPDLPTQLQHFRASLEQARSGGRERGGGAGRGGGGGGGSNEEPVLSSTLSSSSSLSERQTPVSVPAKEGGGGADVDEKGGGSEMGVENGVNPIDGRVGEGGGGGGGSGGGGGGAVDNACLQEGQWFVTRHSNLGASKSMCSRTRLRACGSSALVLRHS